MAEHGPFYLSQNDAIMWMVETDPLLRSTIVVLLVLDRTPPYERVAERVLRAVAGVPALRQRVVAAPLHRGVLQWVPVDEVDLDDHLRRVRAPEPGGTAELLSLTRATAAAAFDRDRPLWEFTLVEGLESGGAAFIVKAHHVVSDGIGAVQLATHLLDLTPDAAPGLVEMPPSPIDAAASTPGSIARWRDALVHDASRLGSAVRSQLRAAPSDFERLVRDPIGAAAGAVETLRSVGRTVAPTLRSRSPVMTARGMRARLDTLEVPLAELRAAVKSAGGTLNDGYLAAIAGGMRRYHEHHGAPVGELRMAMPISVRSDEHGAGGNHVTVLRCNVPVAVADPVARIEQMHALGLRLRSERSLPHTEAIAGVLNLVPHRVIGAMLKGVDFFASNVPGVTVPLYLAGSEVERIYPFGPTAGSSVNFTTLSYRDRCFVGVHSDVAAIPDGDVFLRCVADGFDEVLAARG